VDGIIPECYFSDKSICQVTTNFNIPSLNFSNLVSLGKKKKKMETVPGGMFGRAITFLKRILCHISNNSPLELQIALLKNGIESVRRIFYFIFFF